MQSVCVLLPSDYATQIVEYRALLSHDPAIGALYDPPFAHFTIQLAEEYDWGGLERSLTAFAADWEPFELATSGLLFFTGEETGVTVSPRKDRRLLEFHAAAWEVVSAHAQGRVAPFYHPDNWVPHVTIKRTGGDAARAGAALAKLANHDFKWTTRVDNIAVQHDPGKNSQTHYLRLRCPLRGAVTEPPLPHATMNATIMDVATADDPEMPGWLVRIALDDGHQLTQMWDAPTRVRIMAKARASSVQFAGARCRVDGDTISAVIANSPLPTI